MRLAFSDSGTDDCLWILTLHDEISIKLQKIQMSNQNKDSALLHFYQSISVHIPPEFRHGPIFALKGTWHIFVNVLKIETLGSLIVAIVQPWRIDFHHDL